MHSAHRLSVPARRTILSVPGSSPRFLERSTSQAVDEVMLDLEDGVAAGAKSEARSNIVRALTTSTWAAPTIALRVNGWQSSCTYKDVIEVLGVSGDRVNSVVLPKVTNADEVAALDLLITQIERDSGLPEGQIGLEILIENAKALRNIDAIAQSSARIEALVLGPGDMMASLGVPNLRVGALSEHYPGDPLHHVYSSILVAARANGLQAIDGPYVAVRDSEGFLAAARRSAALGFDGKWVLHPAQIPLATQAYTPDEEQVERAQIMVQSAAEAARRGTGAVMVGAEMVDEAGVQLASATLARHRRLSD